MGPAYKPKKPATTFFFCLFILLTDQKKKKKNYTALKTDLSANVEWLKNATSR